MDIELKEVNPTRYNCKNTVTELQSVGYKQKPLEYSFTEGQKYYEVDDTLPNCVKSYVCNNTFKNNDWQYGDKEYRNQCTIKEYKYKDEDGNIVSKPTNKPVNTSNNIYYRKCPLWGCKSGTSAIDTIKSTVGGKRTHKKRRRFRRTRK